MGKTYRAKNHWNDDPVVRQSGAKKKEKQRRDERKNKRNVEEGAPHDMEWRDNEWEDT